MSDDIILVTGGFDPLHSGHIAYINEASQHGRVVVGVNSDEWLKRKKGKAFMPLDERMEIMRNLKHVLCAIAFNDEDDTACDAILKVKALFPKNNIIFTNGGDRVEGNIPETISFADDPRVRFLFGVGGFHKKNSSSWLLREWKEPKTERNWGYFRVLHDVPGMKVKELTIEPHSELSMQKHENRNELWIVSEGKCTVNSLMESGYEIPPRELNKHDFHFIVASEWHKLFNPYDEPCRIVEVQYGSSCTEDDIIRK